MTGVDILNIQREHFKQRKQKLTSRHFKSRAESRHFKHTTGADILKIEGKQTHNMASPSPADSVRCLSSTGACISAVDNLAQQKVILDFDLIRPARVCAHMQRNLRRMNPTNFTTKTERSGGRWAKEECECGPVEWRWRTFFFFHTQITADYFSAGWSLPRAPPHLPVLLLLHLHLFPLFLLFLP